MLTQLEKSPAFRLKMITVFTLGTLAIFSGCGSPVAKTTESARDTEFDEDDLFLGTDAGESNGFRECVVMPNGRVRILWKSPSEESRSSEEWQAGSSFGRNSRNKPNIGFSSQDGSIVNGTPNSTQPKKLDCSRAKQLGVGWKFSNNVHGLTKAWYIEKKIVRKNNLNGIETTLATSGQRHATYFDPAHSSPYTSQPSQPYYDETADEGAGRVTLHRWTSIGTDRNPNIVIRTRRGGKYPLDRQRIAVSTAPSFPLHEIFQRSLERGRPIVTLELASGTLIARFQNGTVVNTTVQRASFQRNEDSANSPHVGVCAGVSGIVSNRFARIAGQDPRLEVKTRRDLSRPVSDLRFSCNLGYPEAKCRDIGEAALGIYGPPACFY